MLPCAGSTARIRPRPTARRWRPPWCRTPKRSSGPSAICLRNSTMAIEILLPRLGWTMEEGVFLEWLKQDGDVVQPGDLLFLIESDKATNEVETFEHGILRIAPDGPQPGATLPVGAVLGYLVQPGERAPFEQGSGIGDRV